MRTNPTPTPTAHAALYDLLWALIDSVALYAEAGQVARTPLLRDRLSILSEERRRQALEIQELLNITGGAPRKATSPGLGDLAGMFRAAVSSRRDERMLQVALAVERQLLRDLDQVRDRFSESEAHAGLTVLRTHLAQVRDQLASWHEAVAA